MKIWHISVFIFTLLCSILPVFGGHHQGYEYSADILKGECQVDSQLHSEFFNSYHASLPWYIVQHNDGTFENTLGGAVTEKDKTPIEHTSNCISTHQGRHVMSFCDARLKSSGQVELVLYGGLPAYNSSLLIQINGNSFTCFFKAVYPVHTGGLRWNIVSKELIIKNNAFRTGDRFLAKIRIEFEEVSTYQGTSSKQIHKIEGFLKPVLRPELANKD